MNKRRDRQTVSAATLTGAIHKLTRVKIRAIHLRLLRFIDVLETLLILVLGLTPSVASIFIMRQSEMRAQQRLQLAIESVQSRGLPMLRLQPDQHYIEGLGYIIGDITCQYNARSNYLRCAINPFGPCHECSHYQMSPDK
ncbi:DUF6464 family protein [Leptolyngbya sp. AN02str]|uniref:DUF6464 family protein n=1 Tax=Leptolyngbya sp. AN02str TaxID=3423363 RepID=UPI003D322508